MQEQTYKAEGKRAYESELGRCKTATRKYRLDKETARVIQNRILALERILQTS